jgi:hypothetical protein
VVVVVLGTLETCEVEGIKEVVSWGREVVVSLIHRVAVADHANASKGAPNREIATMLKVYC